MEKGQRRANPVSAGFCREFGTTLSQTPCRHAAAGRTAPARGWAVPSDRQATDTSDGGSGAQRTRHPDTDVGRERTPGTRRVAQRSSADTRRSDRPAASRAGRRDPRTPSRLGARTRRHARRLPTARKQRVAFRAARCRARPPWPRRRSGRCSVAIRRIGCAATNRIAEARVSAGPPGARRQAAPPANRSTGCV